ncbi:MAG: IS66 family transposase, partial [bacterium]|nr:IS66 family transposase [bacterium]
MADDIEKLLEIIAVQGAQIRALQARVAELERQLKLDSSNSSKPPSSDGLKKKPRTTSLREKGKKKSGGQKGHKGQTLCQVKNPDDTIAHKPHECAHCGGVFHEDNMACLLGKRQVFDVPEPRIEVTEHRIYGHVCADCGHFSRGVFPQDVNAAVQYGPRVQNIAVYLQNHQLLPEDRAAEAIKDLFELGMSAATLATISGRIAKKLTPKIEQIEQAVAAAKIKHLDETGFRIGGKLRWLHVTGTAFLTHYRAEEKRGAMPENMRGIMVHDHWKPYFKMQNVSHALCNAHHLRELKAAHEIDGEEWAGWMAILLRAMRKITQRHIFEATKPDIESQNKMMCLYDQILEQGRYYHENLPPLKSKTGRKSSRRRKGHNLVRRLQRCKPEVLRFWHDHDVPFTNNLAERDQRMMKVRQKISGGFRTMNGAQNFATLRSFISSARKQRLNILAALQNPEML